MISFSQNNEIEKIIQVFLVPGIVHPSTSPYSSQIVIVLKKEGDWRMFLEFWALNQITIKDKFSILIIDDISVIGKIGTISTYILQMA